MKEKRSRTRTLAAVLLIGVLLATVIMPVSARIIEGTISKGEEKVWPLDPGDTLNVYYYPNSAPSTVAYKQNLYMWLQNPSPPVYINIYASQQSWGGPPYTYLYSDAVGPYYTSYSNLLLSTGEYKFEVKNYNNGNGGTFVYLKVY